MSNTDLNKIANRAADTLQGREGFVRAYADTSSDPPSIIYEFSDPTFAEKYKFERETQGTGYKMEVKGSRLIEYRE